MADKLLKALARGPTSDGLPYKGAVNGDVVALPPSLLLSFSGGGGGAAMSTQYEIYEPGKGFSATQKRRRRRRVSTVDLGQMYHYSLMSTISSFK